MCDVTRILGKMEAGDPLAAEQLLTLIYDELRKLAAEKWPRRSPGRRCRPRGWSTRRTSGWWTLKRSSTGTVGGISLQPPRRPCGGYSYEQARCKRRLKRGGDLQRVDLDRVDITLNGPSTDVLTIDEALTKLSKKKPEVAELVKLRYFAGLSVDEAANALAISSSTADRHWTYARAWLYRELCPEGEL